MASYWLEFIGLGRPLVTIHELFLARGDHTSVDGGRSEPVHHTYTAGTVYTRAGMGTTGTSLKSLWGNKKIYKGLKFIVSWLWIVNDSTFFIHG